jgi:hypothetical protein
MAVNFSACHHGTVHGGYCFTCWPELIPAAVCYLEYVWPVYEAVEAADDEADRASVEYALSLPHGVWLEGRAGNTGLSRADHLADTYLDWLWSWETRECGPAVGHRKYWGRLDRVHGAATAS